MTPKQLGYLLIAVGIVLTFSFFVFSDWNLNIGILGNVRYAFLFDIEVGYSYYEFTLGQALIIPFILVLLGLLFFRGIIDEETSLKILPFLKRTKKE